MAIDLRTNIAKAKGLGSSKSGYHHWWHQRLTAIILVIFSLWGLYFIATIADKDFMTILEIVQKPFNIVPLIILSILVFYHSMLGIKVVIEDYIQCLTMRNSLIILLQIFTLITIFALIVSLLRVMTL